MATNKRLIKSNDEGGGVVPTSFNTVLYTGNGSTQSVTGVGFQPDLVWIKDRNAPSDHQLQDSVRGTNGVNGYLSLASNANYGESTFDAGFKTSYGSLTNLNADGFTVVAGSDATNTYFNNSSRIYAAWCWKAGGAAVTNTDGTITSQVSANTEAGFSIVSYTGNGTAGATFGHGLNQAPELMIPKNRDEAESWVVSADAIGKSYILALDNPNGILLRANQYYYDWDSTTITTGSQIHTNGLNDKIIAYCFHSVAGFSKFGSYTGTASTGNFVSTSVDGDGGFEPAFVMIKRTNPGTTNSWVMLDNKRSTSNPRNELLLANVSDAEYPNNIASADFNSNGFTLNTTSSNTNASGGTYIYMAFANQF